MAPTFATSIPRHFEPSLASDEFRAQWIHPGEVFSVLLILGGDVVARAMAQVAGSGLSTVAFSFGWVAYAISTLVSAFGEKRLMAEPDCKCKVINLNGSVKDNSSWIIGRIVRDYEHWMDHSVKLDTEKMLKDATPHGKDPLQFAGLVVTIYEPSDEGVDRTIKGDWVYWIGIPVMLLQLGIAAIPCGLFGDWSILIITASGIVLCLITGVLPQWKKEKWACRDNNGGSKHTGWDFILTRGNGAQHAIVILHKNGRGLNLEDLASGQTHVPNHPDLWTVIALLTLAILWVLLLITAAGLTANTWFLLAVGGMGMLQNIYVASAPRKPENFGIHLQKCNTIARNRVLKTLEALEEEAKKNKDYIGIADSLAAELFPHLHEDERRWGRREGEGTATGDDGVIKKGISIRVATKEATGREVVGIEVVGREVVGREVVGGEVVGREVIGREAAREGGDVREGEDVREATREAVGESWIERSDRESRPIRESSQDRESRRDREMSERRRVISERMREESEERERRRERSERRQGRVSLA